MHFFNENYIDQDAVMNSEENDVITMDESMYDIYLELDSIAMEVLSNPKRNYDAEPTLESGELISIRADLEHQKAISAILAADIALENYSKDGYTADQLQPMIESTGNGFLEKVKGVFKKIWGWLTDMFGKAKAWLVKFFDFAAKYATKHEKDILANGSKLANIEFKGYRYSLAKLSAGVNLAPIQKHVEAEGKDVQKLADEVAKGKLSSFYSKGLEAKGSEKEAKLNYIAKEIVKTNVASMDDFKKEYTKLLQGGMEERADLKGWKVSAGEIVKFLKDKNTLLGALDKTYTQFKKAVSAAIKTWNDVESKVNSMDKDPKKIANIQKIVSNKSALQQNILSVGTAMTNIFVQSIKGAASQAYAVAKKLVAGGAKDTSAETSGDKKLGESFIDYDIYSTDPFFLYEGKSKKDDEEEDSSSDEDMEVEDSDDSKDSDESKDSDSDDSDDDSDEKESTKESTDFFNRIYNYI